MTTTTDKSIDKHPAVGSHRQQQARKGKRGGKAAGGGRGGVVRGETLGTQWVFRSVPRGKGALAQTEVEVESQVRALCASFVDGESVCCTWMDACGGWMDGSAPALFPSAMTIPPDTHETDRPEAAHQRLDRLAHAGVLPAGLPGGHDGAGGQGGAPRRVRALVAW